MGWNYAIALNFCFGSVKHDLFLLYCILILLLVKLLIIARQILMGEPPNEGHIFEYNWRHKSKETKRALLSK